MNEVLNFLESNKYLMQYYYVYRYKSYRRAAENFYISTSDRNMSYAVSQLETFYDVQLVMVRGNKMEFTEFGHLLGETARKVYDIQIETMSQMNRINVREMRFATPIDSYKFYVQYILDAFQEENPDVKIIVIKTYYEDAVRRLRDGEIDFYVGPVAVERSNDLNYKELEVAKTSIMYKMENRDKFNQIESLSDIVLYRGASKDNTSIFYNCLHTKLEELDISLNIVFETSDVDSLVHAVKQDRVDYAFVGKYYRDDEVEYTDVTHLFEPLSVCFVWRKAVEHSRAIEILMKVYAETGHRIFTLADES